ncbi:MAG: GntP family permease [Eubacteriales bacterium]|nr:GntP family permease [Eubacteriales bacterium]
MLGVIGIFVALAVLVYLTFKGWHMGVVALASSLIVILTGGMDVWPAISESFAGSFTSFAGSWFLIFSLGAIFGKVMDQGGASLSIANWMVKVLGKKHIVLIVLLTTLVLSYGGIGVFVIAFTMYPICMALFKEADIPKKIFPGLLLAVPATITMVFLPGTPSTQNLIPTEFFGTTIYAAPVIGIITSVFVFALDFVFYNWVVKRCAARGEHFVASPGDDETKAQSAEELAKLPSPAAAFAPLVVLIVSIFIFQQVVSVANYAVCLGMLLAILVALVLYRGKMNVKETIHAGTTNGLNTLMVTSCIMGFGGVVTASPTYAACTQWLLSLDMSPLLLMFFSINVICMITGSSTGGLNIFLNSMSEYLISTGMNLQILHRLSAIASAGLDAMPHASGVVIANSVAKTDMIDTYKYTFVSQCLIPMLGFGLAVILYMAGLC